ncbi:IS30 family transposase, partial [Clostridium sp. Mt-5]
MLDDLISPLIKRGQSIAHIYANHGHEIPCSRRTLYHYLNKGVFEARNIDLRRRVRYKCKER